MKKRHVVICLPPRDRPCDLDDSLDNLLGAVDAMTPGQHPTAVWPTSDVPGGWIAEVSEPSEPTDDDEG